MSATLKKITAKAKMIRKAHPSIKWTSAIKQASAALKKQGVIGKAQPVRKRIGKKVGKVKRKRVTRAVTRTAGRRVVRRRRKHVGNVAIMQRAGGAMGKVSVASLKSEMLGRLKAQLGNLYVKYYMTQSISETKRLQKQIAEVKRKIRQQQK